MKRIVSIILIILLGLQAFHSLAIYSYYYANQSFIAAVLCENKEKTQLQCKGKCFLKKQLKKAEEQNSKDQATVKSAELIVYLATTPILLKQPLLSVVHAYPPLLANVYSFQFLSSPLRPPCI